MGCGPSRPARLVPCRSEDRNRDERRRARQTRSRHRASQDHDHAEAGPSNYKERAQTQQGIELAEIAHQPNTAHPESEADASIHGDDHHKGTRKGKEKDTRPYPVPSSTATASQPGQSHSTRHHRSDRPHSRFVNESGRAGGEASGSVRCRDSRKGFPSRHRHHARDSDRHSNRHKSKDKHKYKDKDRTKPSRTTSREANRPPRAARAPAPGQQHPPHPHQSLPPVSPEAMADHTPSLLNHRTDITIPPQEGIHNPFGGGPPTAPTQGRLYPHVHTPTPRPSTGGIAAPPPWIDTVESGSDGK